MKPLLQASTVCVLWGAFACGSSADSRSMGSSEGNVCESDQDCGDGTCVSGRCRAQGSWVKRVLIETTPVVSPSSGEYGDIRYLEEHQVGSGGALDIALDVVTELTVAVRPPQDDCQVSNMDPTGYLPVRLAVRQDPRINGISAVSTEATSDAQGNALKDGNLVSVSVAPGLVDLYIDPTIVADDGTTEASVSDACDLAPVLERAKEINPGRPALEHRLSPAKHVSVDVRAVAAQGQDSPFEGWILDMVEPIDGRRLSSRRVLSNPEKRADGKLYYQVRLAYNPVLGADSERLSGTELFRLTPPSGTVAPKHFMSRSALDLFGAEKVVLPEDTPIPTPVVVLGLVEAAVGGAPLRADIIASLESGAAESSGIMASFQAVTRSDEHGLFKLELVPGNYRVATVPVGGAVYASQSVTWTVASTPLEQAGKLISVRASARLSGVVMSQSQKPLADAAVVASPSSRGKLPTFLDQLLGLGVTTQTRAQMGTVDASGAFELPMDPGLYDVTVRPAQNSGYPWAVRPNTDVIEGIVGLPDLQVRNPVTFSGKVTVPGQTADSVRVALPGALIRVFALFGEADHLADVDVPAVSAIEIGETRADVNGKYRLLLPDRLN